MHSACLPSSGFTSFYHADVLSSEAPLPFPPRGLQSLTLRWRSRISSSLSCDHHRISPSSGSEFLAAHRLTASEFRSHRVTSFLLNSHVSTQPSLTNLQSHYPHKTKTVPQTHFDLSAETRFRSKIVNNTIKGNQLTNNPAAPYYAPSPRP